MDQQSDQPKPLTEWQRDKLGFQRATLVRLYVTMVGVGIVFIIYGITKYSVESLWAVFLVLLGIILVIAGSRALIKLFKK